MTSLVGIAFPRALSLKHARRGAVRPGPRGCGPRRARAIHGWCARSEGVVLLWLMGHVPGRILDERYTQLLMADDALSLADVLLLDRIQKRQRIGRDEHQRLRATGLVEGRYPNGIVSADVAKATGQSAKHIRDRGFDKKYYLDMILALVGEHGPVDRQEIDRLLMDKLPDRLDVRQKRERVHNLLQSLRRSGRIINQGTRAAPVWVLSAPSSLGTRPRKPSRT